MIDVGTYPTICDRTDGASRKSKPQSDRLLVAALPIGLMGGLATAAYMDLIIRSSPTGLHGTVLMMSSGLYYIAVRFGDVLGTAFTGAFPLV